MSALSEHARSLWAEIKERFRVGYERHRAAVDRCVPPSRRLVLPLGQAGAGTAVSRFVGCNASGTRHVALPKATGANAMVARALDASRRGGDEHRGARSAPGIRLRS